MSYATALVMRPPDATEGDQANAPVLVATEYYDTRPTDEDACHWAVAKYPTIPPHVIGINRDAGRELYVRILAVNEHRTATAKLFEQHIAIHAEAT